jgi:hypothetical protein
LQTFRGNRQTSDPIRDFNPALLGLLEPTHEHIALLRDLVDGK